MQRRDEAYSLCFIFLYLKLQGCSLLGSRLSTGVLTQIFFLHMTGIKILFNCLLLPFAVSNLFAHIDRMTKKASRQHI